jgi:hypothetical protein
MTTIKLFFLALLATIVCFHAFRLVPVLEIYFLYRGKRLITCPETLKMEMVDVAARTVAAGCFPGWPVFRLDRCSRWLEHQDWGHYYLKQITAHPENCLVWNIVSNWYLG